MWERRIGSGLTSWRHGASSFMSEVHSGTGCVASRMMRSSGRVAGYDQSGRHFYNAGECKSGGKRELICWFDDVFEWI